MKRWLVPVVAVLVVVGAGPGVLLADEDGGLSAAEVAMLAEAATSGQGEAAVPRGPDWGTTDQTWVTVPASSCVDTDNYPAVVAWGWYYGTDGEPRNVDCWVPLSTGTLLYAIGLEYDDADASANVGLTLRECDLYSINCTAVVNQFSTGSPGKGFLGWYFPNLTIDNFDHFYMIRIFLGSGTSTTKFRNVFLSTRLQVKPAPAVATFGDVPTGHIFFQYVEALADSGITAGCGGGNFCPDQALTRGQMAVFLSKALGLHWPY